MTEAIKQLAGYLKSQIKKDKYNIDNIDLKSIGRIFNDIKVDDLEKSLLESAKKHFEGDSEEDFKQWIKSELIENVRNFLFGSEKILSNAFKQTDTSDYLDRLVRKINKKQVENAFICAYFVAISFGLSDNVTEQYLRSGNLADSFVIVNHEKVDIEVDSKRQAAFARMRIFNEVCANSLTNNQEEEKIPSGTNIPQAQALSEESKDEKGKVSASANIPQAQALSEESKDEEGKVSASANIPQVQALPEVNKNEKEKNLSSMDISPAQPLPILAITIPPALSALEDNGQVEKVNPINTFIEQLNSYITMRRKNNEYYSFWSRFIGFSKLDKITAASKMIEALKDSKIKFSDKDVEALRDSSLGKIIAANQKYLPKIFLETEKLLYIKNYKLFYHR